MEEYELLEFLKDIMRYINQTGQKEHLCSWLENQGFDIEEVENKIEIIKNL
ncbi:hypothetical protein [uncultured Tenacibaculum sp.]|uniref:hypothetical protein n=1 Tax=uncultured Tenacibaculum sp. TaxID=174713 RepID=UPI0026024D8E|nr:hypothetical protein [uncultured Tenacibaculum sp.]